MDSLYLLLDEELTNKRFDRSTVHAPWGGYTPEDQALWFQFFSLFYDRVYIPVNFLTDSDQSLRFLELLRIQDDDSVFRLTGNDGPTILWDTSRFPDTSVTDVVRGFERAHSDTSKRDQAIALSVAKLCDSYIPNARIARANMKAHLDRRESLAQLRKEVFNLHENRGLGKALASHLRDLVNKIEHCGERPGLAGDIGYGRDFFYSIFGFARTPEDEKKMRQFSNVVSEYFDYRAHFLTAVDYVSHSLKALFAGRALGRSISVLMPPEYAGVVLRRGDWATLASSELSRRVKHLRVGERYPYYLDRQALIKMNAAQLQQLHETHEYQAFRQAVDKVRQAVDIADFAFLEASASDALRSYLDRVCLTLNRKQFLTRRVAALVIEALPLVASKFFHVSIGIPGDTAPHPIGGGPVVKLLFEPITTGLATSAVKYGRVPLFKNISTVRLSEDLKIHF